jgi:hypothetical protein
MAVKRSIPIVLANHISGAVLFGEQIGARRPWIFDFSRNGIERNTFKAFHYKKGEAKHGKVTAKNLIDDACFIVKQNLDNPNFECGDNPNRKVYTELRNKYYVDSDSLDCQVELRLHDIIDYANKHKELFYWHKVKSGEVFPAICLTPQKWAQLLHDGYVSGIETKQKGDKADDDVFKYSSSRFARVSLSVKTIINRILVKFPNGCNDPKTMCDASCGYRKSVRGIPIWDLLTEFKNQIMKPKPEKFNYCGSCYDYENDFVYVTDDGEVFERDSSENKFFDDDVIEFDCLKVKNSCDLIRNKKTTSVKEIKPAEHSKTNESTKHGFHKRSLCKSKSINKISIAKTMLLSDSQSMELSKDSSFDKVCKVVDAVIKQNEKNLMILQQLETLDKDFSDDQRDILHDILSTHEDNYSGTVVGVDLAVKREDEILF